MADGVNVTEEGLARALAPFLKPGVKVSLATYDLTDRYSYEALTLSLDGKEVSLFTDDVGDEQTHFSMNN